MAAACFSLFLLSLLGLPVTAGFLGKFYIFNAALASHLVWLAVLLALNSVIASYYYLRVIVAMYMREPNQKWPPAHALGGHARALVAAAGTVYLGLFPGRIMGSRRKLPSRCPAGSCGTRSRVRRLADATISFIPV